MEADKEKNVVRNRGGRPRVDGLWKRNVVVSTKLTRAECDILEAKAEKARLTLYEYLQRALNGALIGHHTYETMRANIQVLRMSSFVRMIIVESQVKEPMTVEQAEAIARMNDGMNHLYRELNAIGRNLNEVARKANAGFARDYAADLKRFGDEVLAKCREYSRLKD